MSGLNDIDANDTKYLRSLEGESFLVSVLPQNIQESDIQFILKSLVRINLVFFCLLRGCNWQHERLKSQNSFSANDGLQFTEDNKFAKI